MIETSIEASNVRAKNGGVLPVEDARALQAHGAAAGVDRAELPKASTPEEVLLSRGMTPDELDLYKGTLNKDQQSNYQFVQKPQFQDSHPLYDVHGNMREALTPAERAVVLKANCIQYQDFVAGATAAKIVPEGTVGELLHGKGAWGETTLGGDVGLTRNYEGVNASGKVQLAGLDYDGSPYVDGEGASKKVRDDVAKKVYQVEQEIGTEHVEAAKVVLGTDMYETAYQEAHRLAALRAAGEEVEIPALLELDEKGYLKHVADPRLRNHAEDPSAGMGYTATMGLRDDQGNQYFRPNQELTMTKRLPYTNGAELVTIDDKGNREVIATFDAEAKAFKLAPGLSDGDKDKYMKMMQNQEQMLAAEAAKKALGASG